MVQDAVWGREIERAAGVLRQAGVDSPRLSAEVLACHVLGWDRLKLVLGRKDQVEIAIGREFWTLVHRRAKGEPVAYIIGKKEFYGREFAVGPGILVPRPETELIVDLAVSCLKNKEKPVFADMGTGSGAIAVSLALEVPRAQGVGVDLSPVAAQTARGNSISLGAGKNLAVVRGDFVHPPVKQGSLDLLVSNPPYVTNSEYMDLSAEVRDFEPVSALVGGESGLELVRDALSSWSGLLKSGGLLLVEIGWRQGAEVAVLAADDRLGFCDINVIKDLAGLDRVLRAVKM